jgi:hypothetical protein
MRIAAMAAGAVGGYFAARLAAAGHDVFFIARGAHREAIVKYGLKVESVLGDLHLAKPNVTDDPAKVGPVDIVLFAVKLLRSRFFGLPISDVMLCQKIARRSRASRRGGRGRGAGAFARILLDTPGLAVFEFRGRG